MRSRISPQYGNEDIKGVGLIAWLYATKQAQPIPQYGRGFIKMRLTIWSDMTKKA